MYHQRRFAALHELMAFFSFFRSPKSQGLPLNVIVIAILVLVVLVVLMAIFGSKAGLFSKEASSCGIRGGVCCGKLSDKKCPSQDLCPEGYATIEETNCGEGVACCVKVIGDIVIFSSSDVLPLVL